MEVVDKNSYLWEYMPDDQKGLILDGEQLLSDTHDLTNVSDFSFLVFPFSKAYEGFLKKMFLDLEMIKEDDYYGDSIRIGRILNPMFMKEKNSLYNMLCLHDRGGKEITERLWSIWKRARNQVFHYFPHNFRKLSYDEALTLIKGLVDAMDLAARKCEL